MSIQRDYKVRAVKLTNVTVQKAVEKLREMGIPVCFEQMALVPEEARRLANGSIEYERTHFDCIIHSGAISAALDVLCNADPDYTWEKIGYRPTYVVYPVRDSALTWRLPPHDVTGVDWIAAIQSFNLDLHHIALFPRGLERQPRVLLPALVSAETMARRWLGAVVDYVNQGRYWSLGGVVGSRILVIGQVAACRAD